MSRAKAELLLASVIIARSTSFLLSKLILNTIEPFNLLSIRFLSGFIILGIIFNKKIKKTKKYDITHGIILGILLFSILSFELNALKTIPSSMSSFIENTAIVFVPIFEAILLKKLPKLYFIISILITLLGIGLLTLENMAISLSIGQIYCLISAQIYAAMIISTAKFSRKGDPIILGIIQIATVGILGLIASFVFETPTLQINLQSWIYILTLVLLCTVFGFTFQPLAQKYIDADRAGQFCALAPINAAILGWIFLDEKMNFIKITGAILIILSLVLTSFKKNTTIKENSY